MGDGDSLIHELNDEKRNNRTGQEKVYRFVVHNINTGICGIYSASSLNAINHD